MNVMKYNCTYKYNNIIYSWIIIIVIMIEVCVCVLFVHVKIEIESEMEMRSLIITYTQHTYLIIPWHLYNNQLTCLLFFFSCIRDKSKEWMNEIKKQNSELMLSNGKSFTNTKEITSTENSWITIDIDLFSFCLSNKPKKNVSARLSQQVILLE